MSAQQTPPKIDDGARIIPVVQLAWNRGFIPWPATSVPRREDTFVEILPDIPEQEFGSVMAQWLDVRNCPHDTTKDAVLLPFLEDEMEPSHLMPGLRVIASDGRTITSGCCCCLGEWREWLDFLEGKRIWLGHDPSPGILLDGAAVRIWSDYTLEDQSQAFEIALPVYHYVQELEAMRLGLVAFGERIEAWLVRSVGREIASRMHQKFDRDFSISGDFREELKQYYRRRRSDR